MNDNTPLVIIIVGLVFFFGLFVVLLPMNIPILSGFENEKSGLPVTENVTPTVPDPATDPCFDLGTGMAVHVPSKEWYNQVCPNLTRLSKTNTNKALFTKQCACYESKNR